MTYNITWPAKIGVFLLPLGAMLFKYERDKSGKSNKCSYQLTGYLNDVYVCLLYV